MSNAPNFYPPVNPVFEAQSNVLGRRFLAYGIDLFVILFMTLVFGFFILLLGVLTFGLGWMLFPALVPGCGILYSALTVGGVQQATIGMRFCGLKMVDASTGGRVSGLMAAIHALLYYLAIGTFLLWLADIAIGFFRRDSRLGHDLLTGFMVVNR